MTVDQMTPDSYRDDQMNDNFKIKEASPLARIAAWKLGSNNVAFVLGKTIHLYNVSRDDFLKNEKWLRHECCHIRQFREHGFFTFILKYTWESLRNGYHNNKYEAEARAEESAPGNNDPGII